MKQKIKWFIASLMVMVCLQVSAQPEGKFYLFNTAYKVFLSRTASGSNVDQFGVPVEIKKGSSGYSLQFLDNGLYVAVDGAAVKSDGSSAAYATINAVDGGYTVAFTADELLGVEGNDGMLACKNKPESSSFAVLWQLMTQAERDAIVAEKTVAQIEAIAKAADITLAEGDKMAQFETAL